jgi:hypothetical protein
MALRFVYLFQPSLRIQNHTLQRAVQTEFTAEDLSPFESQRAELLAQRNRLRRLLLSLFIKLTEYSIRCLTLDVRCWMFIVFFDQASHFSRPADGPTPES